MSHGTLSREEQRLWHRAWSAGAEAEHARLAPRINLLKHAVSSRESRLMAMSAQLRELRRALALARDPDPADAPHGTHGTHGTPPEQEEAPRLAMAAELAALERADRKAAARIAALERAAKADEEKLNYWTWWAWAGQPAAVDADGRVYEAKIAALEGAVKYWEQRALSASPPTTQAVADRDAMVKHSCSHLSLKRVREAFDS